MNTQQGYILIITLIIAAVMSLLLVSSMHSLIIYQRALNLQEEQHRVFYQLEHVVNKLSGNLFRQKECVRLQDKVNHVIEQIRKGQGCSLQVGRLTIDYLVEDLGDLSCLVVLYKNKLKSTHHYRITVMGYRKHSDMLPITLQVRILKASKRLLSCKGLVSYRALGINSWLQVTNM